MYVAPAITEKRIYMGNGRLYVEDVKRLLRSCDNLPI
jgi:ribosomal protein L24E